MKAKITNQPLKNLKATGKGYDVNDTELPGFGVRVSAQGKPTSYSVRYRTSSGRENANNWRDRFGYELMPNSRDTPFADYLKPMVFLSLHISCQLDKNCYVN